MDRLSRIAGSKVRFGCSEREACTAALYSSMAWMKAEGFSRPLATQLVANSEIVEPQIRSTLSSRYSSLLNHGIPFWSHTWNAVPFGWARIARPNFA